jgi:tRNA (cytidine/uridine-2'-O-)-methyltransferase
MPYEPRFHIVLFRPEIPPNTGNIGRTCVASAAKLWLVRPLGFSLEEKQLRRAGLDYWEHLNLEVVDDWPALVARLPAPRPWVFSRWAERDYFDVEFTAGDVLLFGNESSGLPPAILEEYRDRLIKLPMRPEVRSLNLSSCVCAAAYEVLRQLRQ